MEGSGWGRIPSRAHADSLQSYVYIILKSQEGNCIFVCVKPLTRQVLNQKVYTNTER